MMQPALTPTDEYQLVKQSGLFDEAWYVNQYPDVAAVQMDPLLHFLKYGSRMGRSPSRNFDTAFYASSNPDLTGKFSNLLVHYLLHGQAEGRLPKGKEKAETEGFALPGRYIRSDVFEGIAPRTAGVTVITPTGDRAAVFSKCIQWVLTQSQVPEQWIIVDDGRVPLEHSMRLPPWATYVQRKRDSKDPPHTLSANLLAAIPHIKGEHIFIMEDDDWYAPQYIEYMRQFLSTHDMAGTNLITYYHLQGRVWKTGKPKAHTALAQTAFTRAALPKLQEVCSSDNWEVREQGLVDRYWWHSFDGNKLLVQEHPRIHVGFKGMFGRGGIAEGHAATSWGYKPDPDFEYVLGIIGEDFNYYRSWAERPKKPYVVYTAMAGNYDSIKEPLSENPLFDFVVFSDKEVVSERWKWMPFDESVRNANVIAKKPKIMPHLFFPDYEWSLWIDANIFIVKDLAPYILNAMASGSPISQFRHPERSSLYDEAQICIDKGKCVPEIIKRKIAEYRSMGFADQVPLLECNFMVRRHNDPLVQSAMGYWWREVCNGSERDQLSYPVSLWKQELVAHEFGKQGVSVRSVPELYYARHSPEVSYENYKEKIEAHSRRYARSNDIWF